MGSSFILWSSLFFLLLLLLFIFFLLFLLLLLFIFLLFFFLFLLFIFLLFFFLLLLLLSDFLFKFLFFRVFLSIFTIYSLHKSSLLHVKNTFIFHLSISQIPKTSNLLISLSSYFNLFLPYIDIHKCSFSLIKRLNSNISFLID